MVGLARLLLEEFVALGITAVGVSFLGIDERFHLGGTTLIRRKTGLKPLCIQLVSTALRAISPPHPTDLVGGFCGTACPPCEYADARPPGSFAV
jgi:hypothetical protein